MDNRYSCLSCGLTNLDKIINLGMHSFADRFISKSDEHKSDPTYLLSCSLCSACGFLQNDVITSPEDRYKEVDYSYTSSNSKYAIEHWKQYAEDILGFNIKLDVPCKSILEIGSNDGTLLKSFKDIDETLHLIGVDASPIMVEIANSKGIKTYCEIFGEKKADENLYKDKFDVIIANNVLNHSENPISFLSEAKRFLKSNSSYIVYELPYWKNLVCDKRFDQIYHEHVSYFTIENSINLLSSIDLEIFHIETNNYHGGSLRVFCALKNSYTIKDSVKKYIVEEELFKLKDLDTYKELISSISVRKYKLLEKILKAKNESRPIVCIGAAAKANTFLTYSGLNNTIVDFITDASEYKIGKLTPLTRLPIYPDSEISTLKNPLCIITSWNLSTNLEKIILDLNKNAEILVPHNL